MRYLTTAWRRLPLRGKVFATALLGILFPLVIGLTQAARAERLGRELLLSQLDRSLDPAHAEVARRWSYREGDLLLLAGNDAVRAGLVSEGAAREAAIRFTAHVFAEARGIESVAYFLAGHEEPVWRIGPEPGGGVDRLERTYAIADSLGRRLGDMRAVVPLGSLIPWTGATSAAGATVLAAIGGDAALIPDGFGREEFRGADFRHQQERWLAARRRVDGPELDLVMAAPVEPFVAPFRKAAAESAVALIAGTAVALLLAAILSARLTASMRRLAIASEAVARGDLSRRVDTGDLDEVGQLSRSFDAMTHSLRRTLRELSRGEALAAIGEYAATLAHEVRNPLTAIRFDLQRLARRNGGDPVDREVLDRALHQVSRLDRVVGGSLQVANTGRIERTAVPLGPIIDAAAAGAAPTFAGRGVELKLPDAVAEEVVGDAAALEQLLLNLLLNAAQACSAGGIATIRTSSSAPGLVAVRIEDTGRGMTPDQLARLGQPFYSTRPDGTGLGLTVARRIVTAHEGELRFDSAPGQGTRVELVLPAPVPAAARGT